MRTTTAFAPIWETSTDGAILAKRRKRSGSFQSNSIDDEERASTPESRPRRLSRNNKVDIKDQYHVAGHDPNEPLPSASFPHSPIPTKRAASFLNDSADVFASLNPPLETVPRPRNVDQADSLQRQHVAVMTSILHVSLLRGDYHRAGQAFGLLLRASLSKNNIKLRSGGLWGLGAEISLRQNKTDVVLSPSETFQLDEDVDEDSPSRQGKLDDTVTSLLLGNIPAAKKYFESIILQHPFEKRSPRLIDARSFYPALFSLMIYEASEGSKAAMTKLPPLSDNGSKSEVDLSEHSSTTQAAVAEIKRFELFKARAVAAHMDDIIVSPPYDRFVPLLRLRGMVGLWEADLLDAISEIDDHHDEYKLDDSVVGDVSRQTRARAIELLRRVTKLGGTLPRSIVPNTR